VATASPPLFCLLDGHGNAWLLGVSDGGITTTTLVPSPPVAPVNGIFIQDSITEAPWELIVTTSPIAGIPIIVPTTTLSLQTQIPLKSPGGFFWSIRVRRGIQQTSPSVGCLFQLIGTLYMKNFNSVPWSQPGGPNTVVFPQQQLGPWPNYPVQGQFFIEASGLWTVGCGHFVDYPYIFRDFDPCSGLSMALVACPMCSYVQYGLEPYELFYDPIQNAITII
jgi:hypothetical protein